MQQPSDVHECCADFAKLLFKLVLSGEEGGAPPRYRDTHWLGDLGQIVSLH